MNDPATAVAEPAPTPSSAETGERVYFPELDGLRFVAFMMVYLFHGGVPQGLLARLVGSKVAAAFRDNGGYGVQLFFILSGYLITVLLLREERATAALRCGRSGCGEFSASGRSIIWSW